MSTETKPENSASSPSQATTNLRELLGWCGAMTYMFCMMYGYQIFIADGSWFVNGSWIPSFIMMAFAVSITVFSFRFGRELIRLSKIAGYTTPAAIAATMVIGVLPDTPAAIVSVLAAVLMAPAISRRAYGVIRTSDPKWQITRYMIGWAAALTMFAFWVIAALPRELTFLIPALFAVPAWIGVRRGLSIPDGFVPEKITRLTGRSLVVIVLTVLVMVWFNVMANMLLNNLFAGGNISSQSATVINTLLAWIPLALGIMLFAVVS
ncbi:MAG: hypothetical protein FWD78_17470, partial [Treponema sp.]|nr:hypothetical protein [Treponema sp.]